jgi:hypothetical protein
LRPSPAEITLLPWRVELSAVNDYAAKPLGVGWDLRHLLIKNEDIL